VDDVTKEVEWFITGDMMFLCAIYGHLGPHAAYPCLMCETPKKRFATIEEEGEEALVMRSTATMKKQAAACCEEMRANPSPTPTRLVQTHKRHKGMVAPPLIDIPIENIVPSSLHIVQGLGQGVVDILEKEAHNIGGDERVKALEECYKRLGVTKQAWYQKLTGNCMRLLLTNDSPVILHQFIAESPLSRHLTALLRCLGAIQDATKADFLEDDEIDELDSAIKTFSRDWKKVAGEENVTPKLHWLVAHVVPFARKWRTWGLMSEQSIEHLHHKFNVDEARFASIRNKGARLKRILEQSCLRNALFDYDIAEEATPTQEMPNEDALEEEECNC
jgi:hypothetical protein